MSLSKADLEAIATMIASAQSSSAPVNDATPTEGVKASVKVNDSPLFVSADGSASKDHASGRSVDGDGWLALASTSKTRFNNGARVQCFIDGKSPMAATLPRSVLERLGQDGVIPALLCAIDQVNERAHLGPHAPKRDS